MTRNNKVLLATVFTTAILATSSAAMAQGFYLGGSIGQSKAKDACTGFNISCDDKSTARQIFGGYQVNRNFATELGYTDLGKTRASGVISGANVDATTEVKAWELVGIGSVPVANRFSLYGKLGIYRAQVKQTTTTTTTTTFIGFHNGMFIPITFTDTATASALETNTGLTFGFGAEFDINKNISARAEWQRYRSTGGDNVRKSDVDALGVGLLYRFQ